MIPAHLHSPCADQWALCPGCDHTVKQAPDGRWFITMGHAGFNTPANNRSGYATQKKAESVVNSFRRYVVAIGA